MAQIGSYRVNTGAGVVTLPVFEIGDSGTGIYEFLRVNTPSGIGFIPMTDPSKASHPYLRINTQSYGVVAAHDKASTSSGVWVSQEDRIMKVDNNGNLLKSFNTANGEYATGLGVDGNNCIWYVTYSSNEVYKVDHDGNGSMQFDGAVPRGLAIDNNSCIWTTTNGQDAIYRYDQNGNFETQISTGRDIADGVGVGPNNCLWHADAFSDELIKFDQSGSELTSFMSPDAGTGEGPRGVAVDNNNSVWHVYDSDTVYKTDESGNVLDSFPVSNFSGSTKRVNGMGIID